MAAPIKRGDLADVILAALYEEYNADGKMYLFEADIKKLVGGNISDNLVTGATEILYEKKFLTLDSSRGYRLSRAGIEHAENHLDDRIIHLTLERGASLALSYLKDRISNYDQLAAKYGSPQLSKNEEPAAILSRAPYIRAAIIWSLWLYADEQKFHQIDEFDSNRNLAFGKKIPREDWKATITELESDGLIERTFEPFKGEFLRVSKNLKRFVHDQNETPGTIFWRMKNFGTDIIERALQKPVLQRPITDIQGTADSETADLKENQTNNRDWLEEDEIGALSDGAADKIRAYIEEALRTLPQTTLSNIEKSQANANLGAALALAQAPIPRWKNVRDLLEPMSDLAGIGSLIIAIIALILAA